MLGEAAVRGLIENTMATNFEPHECVNFVQTMKIGTHENKAIHSIHVSQTHLCTEISLFSFKYRNYTMLESSTVI